MRDLRTGFDLLIHVAQRAENNLGRRRREKRIADLEEIQECLESADQESPFSFAERRTKKS